MDQQRPETQVLFLILDGQTKRANLQLSSQCPRQKQSSSGRTPTIFSTFRHKISFPRSFEKWVSGSFSVSDFGDIRQSVLLHTFPWPHWHSHSLSFSPSYTDTPIGYVLGQIVCLISHPHNPTTSKINQAPQKRKKNGIREARRQEIFRKATVNIQKLTIPTGIWHAAYSWEAPLPWKLWGGWKPKSCQ